MTIAAAKRLTADEFMALRDAAEFELIDGNLVERKQMGAQSSYVAAQISRQLGNYAERQGSGWVLESETTYRCFGSADTLRRADVSFIRRGRLAGERLPESYVDIAPDLAVEVVSPSNSANEIENKVLDYFAAGVELVWVAYPQARTIHICRPDGTGNVLREGGQLDSGAVLPGFHCEIAELFPRKAPASAKP